MTGQSSAAAERSFHEAPSQDGVCFVCGGPWRKGKGGTSSYAARCVPPLAQVCSAECAADPKFAGPAGWQPIATAPKDHTEILIWDLGETAVALWIGRHPDDEDGFWGIIEGASYSPTHWMPLPEPPKS